MTDALEGPAAPPERAEARRRRLRAKFKTASIDALLVSNPVNVRYLTGFTGDDSALIISAKDAVFITDPRYTEQAEFELGDMEVFTREGPMMTAVAGLAKKMNVARLGIESASMTVSDRDALAAGVDNIIIVGTVGLIEQLRPRKDPDEMRRIRAAVRIAEAAFESIRAMVRPGVSELEIARGLEIEMLRLGAQSRAFETIVLAGARAAMPHGRPGARRLKSGDPVLIDWGARVGYYNCDLTRVLFVHKISEKYRKIYESALTAQKKALASIKPGVKAGAVDAAARDSLREAGYAECFTHGLGHGVGMDVHEAPGVRKSEERKLRMGMVFTVEPGIYMPGRIGIRIEDMVQVAPDGCRILTGAPKDIASSVIV